MAWRTFAGTSPAELGDLDSTGRDHDDRHNDVELEIMAITDALGDDPAGAESTVAARLDAIEAGGTRIAEVIWNGTEWRFNGAAVTVRPTVAAWPDGYVRWNTSLYPAVVDPPSLAIAGDWWIPNGDAEVVL